MSALFLLPAGLQAQLQLVVDSVDADSYPIVRLAVRVLNGATPVRDLELGLFTAFENGELRQPLRGFCADTLARGPVSALLVMDVSRSMGPWPWGNNDIVDAKIAAKSFIDRLTAGDEAALVSFSDAVYYNQSWTADFNLLKQRIDNLSVIGGTALWDAVDVGANIIESRGGNKVMIVLTDGRDTQSGVSATVAISNAVRVGVRVYTIGIGQDIDRQDLERLATSTGGRYYNAPTSEDLDEIYRDISLEISSTGFCQLEYDSPIDCLNGATVDIEVQVNVGGNIIAGTAQYELPLDSTTFSYVNLSMERQYVVEAGETVAVPVELREVSSLRAPNVFQFDVGYDTGLLTLEGVDVTMLSAGYTATFVNTSMGSTVLLRGASAITEEGTLALLRFRATEVFNSDKSTVSISPPDVQQFCTVASSDDGLITVSGTCERALQGGGQPQKPMLRVLPNPTNSDTRAELRLPQEALVTLSLYNSLGTPVATVFSGMLDGGDHTLPLRVSALPSGVYFLRLDMHGSTVVERVILER